jgi:glutathione S-transferase
MADFTVYGIPGSPYVRSALLGLEEKGAGYTLVPLRFGEQKGPAHRARHPFGRIPVLEHGDFRLYETQAILRYLDRIIPTPPLTPTDPRAEARMNQIAGICDWYMFRDISITITFGRVVAPKLGLPVDEARIAAALPAARLCIDELAALLGEQPFMAGDALSIADLMLAPQMTMFAESAEGRDMLAPHPALAAWTGRMNQRPSLQRTSWERLVDANHAA